MQRKRCSGEPAIREFRFGVTNHGNEFDIDRGQQKHRVETNPEGNKNT
jgi:hypothetical protein